MSVLLLSGCHAVPPQLLAAPPTATVPPADAELHRRDARSLEALVNRVYAYLDRFEGGMMPLSNQLRAEAARVNDRRSLLRYAERALLTLADHHAITGASLADSWAVVPTFADLWVVRRGDSYVVEAVRDPSPASEAGVSPGDHLIAVDDVPTAEAVSAFWADLGLPVTEARAGFAARVLAAGRRDRPRRLALRTGANASRLLDLPSLYATSPAERPPVSVSTVAGGDLVIRINDSLGGQETITAFDAAMSRARRGQRIVLDLRETPSGGNTTVARAILGWFVRVPTAYQMHSLPVEERATGIARQWIEQVLPRTGKHHAGPVRVLVSRWTGSMGEGLAIGFHALGAEVVGTRMAGLLGAIHDHALEHSGLVVKLPTERLSSVDGTPREEFLPGAGEH
jgi:hypothetical protein